MSSHLLAGLAATRHLLTLKAESQCVAHADRDEDASNASMYLAFGCMASALAVIVVTDVDRHAAVSIAGIVGMLALVLALQVTGLRERAQEELRESEDRFRSLSEASFEGLGVSEGGIVIDANTRLAEMLGSSVDAIRNRPVSEFVAPQSFEAVKRHEQSAVEDRYEHLARRADGSTFPVEVQSKTLHYRGRVARVSAIRDVTERREAERRIQVQLRRLAALRAIDEAIGSSHDLRATLAVVLDHVVAELRVDAAVVLLLQTGTQELAFGAATGFRTDAVRHARVRVGESFAGRAALERSVVRAENLISAPNGFARSPLFLSERFQSYLGVPLIVKSQVKGVLEVFHREPLDPDQEWLDFLEALAGQATIAIENMTLFESIQRPNMELALAYDTTLEGWSRALEVRDRETQGHTLRVADFAVRLARTVGMNDDDLVHVRRGALLHDIGKVAIPDGILLKPGPLSDEEWAVMRRHTEYAFHLLSPISFLRPAIEIPYCHHERWDGSGYPRGLRGEEIPIAARVFAVVDSWDALRYDRPYRGAWPVEKIRAYVREKSGTFFDPQVAEAFLALERETPDDLMP